MRTTSMTINQVFQTNSKIIQRPVSPLWVWLRVAPRWVPWWGRTQIPLGMGQVTPRQRLAKLPRPSVPCVARASRVWSASLTISSDKVMSSVWLNLINISKYFYKLCLNCDVFYFLAFIIIILNVKGLNWLKWFFTFGKEIIFLFVVQYRDVLSIIKSIVVLNAPV